MAIERHVPPALPGVLFQRVERDTELSVGYCARYGITRVSAGAFDFVYRRQPLTQDRTTLKLKQPGELHRDVRVHAPVSGWSLGLAPELVEPAAAARGLRRFALRRFLVPRARPLERLGALLARGEPELLALQAALAVAIDALLDHADEPLLAIEDRDPPAAARARALIHDAWRDPLSLDDLARAAGRDRLHTLRAFRRAYGLPPHRYLTHVRVAEARRLLERGVATAEAALEVGFCDQSHLHRHFVRIVGATPGAYARAVQERPSRGPTRRRQSGA